MVKLNKIYTRTGDDGTTGLVRGPRRKKHDVRIDAYGTIEEANALIGVARIHAADAPDIDADLGRIQNDLFDVGSDLATPGSDEGQEYKSLRATKGQVTWLENCIDRHNASLSPLTSFILPGGNALAASLHVARTVVRRAERITTELAEVETDTNPLAMQYLNRLSDLLFVLARAANANGRDDVLWTPGQFSDETAPDKKKR